PPTSTNCPLGPPNLAHCMRYSAEDDASLASSSSWPLTLISSVPFWPTEPFVADTSMIADASNLPSAVGQGATSTVDLSTVLSPFSSLVTATVMRARSWERSTVTVL